MAARPRVCPMVPGQRLPKVLARFVRRRARSRPLVVGRRGAPRGMMTKREKQ